MLLTPRSKSSAFVFALAALGLSTSLSACNDPDSSQTQSVANDWIVEDDVVRATPTPTATPTTTPSPTPSGTDLYTGPAEVEKYVLKFVDDAKAQGIDVLPDMKSPKLEIRIASLDAWGSSTIGLCETGGGKRRVTFDPDFWNSVSETQRELLAHHELGHCVLYRAHRSTTLTSGAYSSVMYPIIMSSSMYNNDYAYYQEELFTYGALDPSALDADGNMTHVCN